MTNQNYKETGQDSLNGLLDENSGIYKDSPVNDSLLTRADLVRRWRCSISTIKRYESSGALQATRIGSKLVRYRMTDINAFEVAENAQSAD